MPGWSLGLDRIVGGFARRWRLVVVLCVAGGSFGLPIGVGHAPVYL
jgi:hypothetical protein